MDLSNLKINFLGDSITFGACATSEEKSYIGLLRKRYPDAVIRNYSVGGSCISDKCLWGVPSFNEREAEMDPDAERLLLLRTAGRDNRPDGGYVLRCLLQSV